MINPNLNMKKLIKLKISSVSLVKVQIEEFHKSMLNPNHHQLQVKMMKIRLIVVALNMLMVKVQKMMMMYQKDKKRN